ncbi:energy-coupling factor transporter ATP-binding protein EcfA2 [Bradyrhizobium sp. AZCC 2262]|uniref:AAA family ATPase n=1 Tax=Bradyrhizobium sp. AZCC 2262 TaxID=3117022 RepID=UPI002FF0669C
MNPKIDPFSIMISPKNGGAYKSISNVRWDNIPGFAVLTGRNGAGKTQLLEILAYYYSGAIPPPPATALQVSVNTSGAIYRADEIGYVPSGGRFSGAGGASIANLPNIRQQTLQYAQNVHSYRHDIGQTIRAQKMLNRIKGENAHQIDPSKLAEILKDDFYFALDDIDVTDGLCNVFMAHRFRLLEGLERNTPGMDRNGKPLGPAPWDVVNESLIAGGFPYEVISPSETPIVETYTLRLKDRRTGTVVAAHDLSSGEKVLLQLVLWLFTAGKEGVFPRLLILDEPDAHLHPSMSQQFLDVIAEVLVKKHGVRVILSTHSPSTVALAPENSVFQMERGEPAILPVTSRADIISVLTAGLVTVSRASKFCFVEDEDDVAFYEAVRDILSDYGPSKDPMALNTSPSIAFIPASIGSGSTKVAGGSSVVAKWVNKLDAEPLDKTFLGIIDQDNRNAASQRIRVLDRYSFENYLLDPMVIFSLLVEEGTAPMVPNLQITAGDEHLLRTMSRAVLQSIADEICARMFATEQSLAGAAMVQVGYTTGQTVTVPKWVVDKRGHDLLPIAQRAFGGHRLVNQVRLIKALKRCRLVPVDVARLLREVQTH